MFKEEYYNFILYQINQPVYMCIYFHFEKLALFLNHFYNLFQNLLTKYYQKFKYQFLLVLVSL